jgi:dTDP-4-amino-4,6-dideoxygalactose transaminase
MIVGGEFYEDERWLLDEPGISTDGMVFLNGGKACLIVIAGYLRDHGVETVLLPSYLCPSIVDTLDQCGMQCRYYQVREDFSIDLKDVAEKLVNPMAVYLINYFGFFHGVETIRFLQELQSSGVLLIEDNAQVGFAEHNIGDFVFNSLRKLVPFDGGYLKTELDIAAYIKQYAGVPNRRLPLIRAYRQKLTDYKFGLTDHYDELLDLYRKAEAYYDADLLVQGDERERFGIEHQDWLEIRRRRRENYQYLLSMLPEIKGIQPIFPTLPEEVMPLGLPVFVNHSSRDALHTALGEAGIGLHIHWHELLGDTRLNRNGIAVNMASRIMTLVIDQQTSHKQIDTMVQEMMKLITA